MLRNTVTDIITLLPDAHLWPCPVLLDANCVDNFLDWLKDNPQFIDRLLVDKTWRIAVLRKHLASRSDWRQLQERLKLFQIELIRHSFSKHDELLIAEIQHAYFGDDALSHKSAELLAYGRRYSGEGNQIRVISRHRAFRLVAHVQLYVIPQAQDIGGGDDIAYLRVLDVLDLHRRVQRTAFSRIVSQDYPIAVVEVVKAFFEEVRQIGMIYGESYAAEDGQMLIDQAFDFSKGKTTPKIRLNHCLTETDQNEQKGYHNFARGIASALRNPIAHAPVDTDFIQDRFGDKRAAIKFLCFLSLLFEKLDRRVAP